MTFYNIHKQHLAFLIKIFGKKMVITLNHQKFYCYKMRGKIYLDYFVLDGATFKKN